MAQAAEHQPVPKPEEIKAPQKGTWIDALARISERFVPDAITTAIVLMVILFVASMMLGSGAEEESLVERLGYTVDAYYRGLWMLLAFTMQMTLVLVLSLVLAEAPIFKGSVRTLSRIPKTSTGVIIGACMFSAVIAYANWGLSLALGPMIAVHFCKQAEMKGIKVDFLWLMAVMAGVGSIWQFGLSASAPLLMTAETNPLYEKVGIMPLSTTIFSPASLIMIGSFLLTTLLVGVFLMPKNPRQISEFAESNALAESVITAEVPAKAKDGDKNYSFAQRLERMSWTLLPLYLALGAWIYYHFFTKEGSLDINSMVTILLLSCLVFHRSIFRFTTALQKVLVSAWPVIVLYHLYAGVAGLIQYTQVGESFARLVEPISTPFTFPALTAMISTVVATFIPTSGGQWVIQGDITVTTAMAAGVTAQRGLLALSVGDHMGNLISPFWAVVGAGIARVDFRLMFGYRLIFAAIWFTIGVLCFTFLPC